MNPPTDLIDDLRLLEPPGPWWTQWWALAIAGVLALLLLIFLFSRLRRRLAQRAPGVSQAEATQAQEDALAELQKLFAHVELAESRPFAIESSGVIRRYIERRFDIRAPLRSTEEFLAEAQHSPKLDEPYQALLSEFLKSCDFIKFGRAHANRGELETLHGAAVRFVTETHRGGGRTR